jgi:hypothetical protein
MHNGTPRTPGRAGRAALRSARRGLDHDEPLKATLARSWSTARQNDAAGRETELRLPGQMYSRRRIKTSVAQPHIGGR